MSSALRYLLLKTGDQLHAVSMPASHLYQLTALLGRLHKETGKLTAEPKPVLPLALAECDRLEPIDRSLSIEEGLAYINKLEHEFAALPERAYPLVSLLTEIRALQAQLEQWYEEEGA
ncbi:hydrolase/acyltransferase [Gorillibacterium sp. CAU 1737]|uniref:hydrolase/acyltransferase n=1 Tax=Gorillibacterium sp. CAU 1737 TaxID=3140362 RepID=UPI003260259C